MSRVFNHYFFEVLDVIEQIKSEAEDYNRKYSVKELMSAGCNSHLANKICDRIEEDWDFLAESIIEQEREQEVA